MRYALAASVVPPRCVGEGCTFSPLSFSSTTCFQDTHREPRHVCRWLVLWFMESRVVHGPRTWINVWNLHILRRSIYVVLEVNFRIPDKTGIWCPNCCATRCLLVHRAESCPYNLLLLYLFSLSLSQRRRSTSTAAVMKKMRTEVTRESPGIRLQLIQQKQNYTQLYN